MFCSKCGTEITEGNRFCPACGNQIITPNSDNYQPVQAFQAAECTVDDLRLATQRSFGSAFVLIIAILSAALMTFCFLHIISISEVTSYLSRHSDDYGDASFTTLLTVVDVLFIAPFALIAIGALLAFFNGKSNKPFSTGGISCIKAGIIIEIVLHFIISLFLLILSIMFATLSNDKYYKAIRSLIIEYSTCAFYLLACAIIVLVCLFIISGKLGTAKKTAFAKPFSNGAIGTAVAMFLAAGAMLSSAVSLFTRGETLCEGLIEADMPEAALARMSRSFITSFDFIALGQLLVCAIFVLAGIWAIKFNSVLRNNK